MKSYSHATGVPPSHHVFWWCKILNYLAHTQRNTIFIDYYYFCMMILQKNISMQLRLSCYKNQKRCDLTVKIELGKLDLSFGLVEHHRCMSIIHEYYLVLLTIQNLGISVCQVECSISNQWQDLCYTCFKLYVSHWSLVCDFLH